MKAHPLVLFVIVTHLVFFSHLFSLGGNAGLAPLVLLPSACYYSSPVITTSSMIHAASLIAPGLLRVPASFFMHPR